MTTKFTHCGVCLAACGMQLEVEENRIISLRGDPQHPLTRGYLCEKGVACRDMTTDPLRLLHPYERDGAGWRRISWEEADASISQQLREIIAEHGPNSVGMYYGAGTATSTINVMASNGFLHELGSFLQPDRALQGARDPDVPLRLRPEGRRWLRRPAPRGQGTRGLPLHSRRSGSAAPG